MNETLLFNDGWAFVRTEADQFSLDGGLTKHNKRLDTAILNGLQWKAVDVPHDWLIYDSTSLYENGIGWYRKTLHWVKDGRRAVLSFDGVYMDSALYVNGEFVGEWKNGYAAFEHDMTDVLRDGDNELIVKVVHISPNSRWYSGAGIYRDVRLKIRGNSYLETDGVYIVARKREGGSGWRVDIETEAVAASDGLIKHELLLDGKMIASVSGPIRSSGDHPALSKLTMEIDAPLLWSAEQPHLYRLATRMFVEEVRDGQTGQFGHGEHHEYKEHDENNEYDKHDGYDAENGQNGMEGRNLVEIDGIEQNVGFRDVAMTTDQGLFINGNYLKLNGVCEHHDLGALGAAFNVAALRRRFELLKEMGVNAIRTAHNMPAKQLMELADEMGLWVVSEAFDMWERPKTPYDNARFFKEWAERDVRSWVRRDRNHPSLLMWSIGNEIYDTHADEQGQIITAMLMEQVRLHDPRENGRVTIGSNYMPWENARKCADIVKLAGYNYGEKYYVEHHKEHPDWIIYGSETASVVQSRGIYRFPFERSILTDDDEQCSSLGNSTTSWGAKSPEACIIAERDAPFSLGQFLWTGFDYIGEPTPYHTKNSYFGQLDTATFAKDPYYIYQAAWTPLAQKTIIHLFPYWDFNNGQMIDVRVATNAPVVELQLNGKTIGTEQLDHEAGTQLVAWWKVAYEPGELKAIAYDKDGRILAREVRRSFGDARALTGRADTELIDANGTDLIFVELGAKDESGNPVANANNRIEVKVSGAGRLLGLDNGDSTDYDSYKGVSRRLFSGKLMAIIGATFEPGPIYIEASSPGLQGVSMTFAAKSPAGGTPKGRTADTANRRTACVTGKEVEIPLRKIGLVSPDGQSLDAHRKELTVRAELYPPDTTYREVEWAVVNDAGIPSTIASVEPDASGDGLTARVSAIGDGSFRLRCMSRNGTDGIRLISQLEFTVDGLGTAFKNPYAFLSAGLYDYSAGELTSGNERGVSTARDGRTEVGFRNLDFGPYGSDTITMPIFALSSEPYSLQIWEGMPGEPDSELLADVIYEKETQWNVYQEDTFRLSRRLRGVASICFVTERKMHIKGFTFSEHNRAFEQNDAADNDRIYGDTYLVKGGCVEEIGNNVSLVFGGMNFGGAGCSRLVVYGHSPIDRNTIHVRFSGEAGESNQLIEFTGGDGYEEKVFELERVVGVQTVSLIFLPGSRFHLGWFRFER